MTFDLALARKEYNLVWQHDAFKNVLVCVGCFPAVCSNLGAVERLTRGTGLTTLVVLFVRLTYCEILDLRTKSFRNSQLNSYVGSMLCTRMTLVT